MDNLIDHLFGHPWGFIEFAGVIVLISVTGGLVIGAIAVVTGYFQDRARDEMNATIKMEMLQRGMSAEDIVKVLNAGSATFDPPPWASGQDRHSCRKARRAMRDAMRAGKSSHGHA